MNSPFIRRAQERDLARIWAIRYWNDVAGEAVLPEQGPVPPYLPHLLSNGVLLVAQTADEVIGYGGLIIRGNVSYLTDLFIAPNRQSSAVGKLLLDRIMPAPGTIRTTLASIDHRAIALYARYGMAPRWPNLLLEAPIESLTELPETDAEVIEADVNDQDLIEFDAMVSGRLRQSDLAFFVRAEQGKAFWFRHNGSVVGYGFVRFRAGRLWHPDAVTIGPIGATTVGNANRCVIAATNWARAHGRYFEIAVPGPHSALPALLAAGFRITYVETYCSANATDVDPERYLGSGGDLF